MKNDVRTSDRPEALTFRVFRTTSNKNVPRVSRLTKTVAPYRLFFVLISLVVPALAANNCPKGLLCPSHEDTSWVGWGAAGTNAETIGLWNGTLLPLANNFNGRDVQEVNGGAGVDSCWFAGSAYAKFDRITGGTWTVGAGNVYGQDGVGWFQPAVCYYRTQNKKIPCGTSFKQQMQINDPANGNFFAYGTPNHGDLNDLAADIGAATVSSTRAGVRQVKNYACPAGGALLIQAKDVGVAGAIEVDSYAINKVGVIGGDYIDGSGTQHGMLLDNKGKVTDVDDPNGTSSTIRGLSDKGVAVGSYVSPSGVAVGFHYSHGMFTDIDYPGSTSTEAQGINDSDEVVGYYLDSNGAQHGFTLVKGSYVSFDVPNAQYGTQGYGINDSGLITVMDALNSSFPALSYITTDLKNFTQVLFPGSVYTAIHDVNGAGAIVGTYLDSSSNEHGYLLQNGQYYTFDDPSGLNTTRGDGINSAMNMVGRYTGSSGNPVGYETTPAEPGGGSGRW